MDERNNQTRPISFQPMSLNAGVNFKPLIIGLLKIWPPVILAPMAGITNAPFRRLCRQFGSALFMSEMITARLLVDNNAKTMKMADFSREEYPRSIQLYGTDPGFLGKAVALLSGEDKVDHIDLNFGCPVRKITRKGGGAAIPLKPKLFRKLVASAVGNAGHIPVTVKMRIGINDYYQSFLQAGKIAELEGCAAVTLHARTAEQLYSGKARWEAIASLKEHITTIPVLGNGDIWEAEDARRMMHSTACDGVVIGRGCLGRPWLFRDLRDIFENRSLRSPPTLGEVANIMLQHARLLCNWLDEQWAIQSFRKHAAWYLKGYPDSGELREKLMHISTYRELETVLINCDHSLKYSQENYRLHRGKTKAGGPQKVALPDGYLDNLDDDSPPTLVAEEAVSGG